MTTQQISEGADLYSQSMLDENDMYRDAFSPRWPRNNPATGNGCKDNSFPSWIPNGKQSATSQGMFHQRQPPLVVQAKTPSGIQSDSYGQMANRPLQLQASRRSRHFVPSCRKDEYYWMKRQKNNEAARKSREKRRNNDMILAQNVLVLLQQNIRLQKDLFAVKMKYNEIEPGEYNDFTRKLEDGDLLSGLTHNLNLVDYGIPEHVIKALNSGMEVDLSNYLTMPDERRLSSSQQSLGDSGKDESIGSSSDDYQKVLTSSQAPMNHMSGSERTDRLHPNGTTANMETEEQSGKDRSSQDVMRMNLNNWSNGPAPVICVSAQTATEPSMTGANGTEQAKIYSHDLVKGAEMLQTFIQYSWQQAANNANGQIVGNLSNHVVSTPLSPTLSMPPHWLTQSDCCNSSSSLPSHPGTTGKDLSNLHDSSTLPSIGRESTSSPRSDDNYTWRHCQGFSSSSSSSYQEDWSSKSGDSSSDSGSGSSHVASPRGREKPDDSSNDTGDSDDKSCRLPYKLRFKLATLHGGEQEQVIQQ